MFNKKRKDPEHKRLPSARYSELKQLDSYYNSLLLISKYPHKKGKEKRKIVSEIRKNFDTICGFDASELLITENKKLVVEAIMNQLDKNFEKAIQLYDRSVMLADQNNLHQDKEIACELATSLCKSCGFNVIAENYQLESPSGISSNSTADGTPEKKHVKDNDEQKNDSLTITLESLDISTVINSSHLISSEIILERLLSQLLKILLENAGAEKAYLLLENNGSLFIHAIGSPEKIEIYNKPIEAKAFKGIPLTVINYVKRTLETVVLDNAANNSIFTGDPCIIENNIRSILCYPLIKQQHLTGIVYLENSLASGAFIPDRVELIKLISTQATISIENSLLFEKELKIEMELQEQYEEIQAQYEEMEAMNEELQETTTELFDANNSLAIFKKFTEESAQGMGMTDLKGNLTYANPALVAMLGHDNDSTVTGEDLSQFYPKEMQKRVTGEIFSQIIKGKEWIGELEINSRDKNRTPVIQGFFTIKDGTGDPVYLATILTDMSEQKKLEEQLFQAQKMEAIGTLAGGIAHDFNNLLTAIIGYCDMILLDMDSSDKHSFDIQEILKAAKRSSSLTHQLLAFSRKQILVPKIMDVNHVVRNMTKMLSRLIGENVELNTFLMEEKNTINADRGQVEQVIMNLVVNARDAMPNGGSISITTGNKTITSNDVAGIPNSREGTFICLSIEDNGTGIDEKSLEKIFEPFYSTKGSGKGTGLGLSVVYGIIAQHEGWINIKSTPGKGTTFHVYLPSVLREAEFEPKEQTRPKHSKGNEERILLVEDQKEIIRFATKALTGNGYQVFQARDGNEAKKIFQEENGRFDLIFSDVVLPDTSGTQLVDYFNSLKPDIPALLSSGYTDEMSQWEAIRDRGIPFLEKPYSLQTLLDTISEVLNT